MRLIFLFLILAFPIAEILVLIKLFNAYGIWVLCYLVVVALLGLQLIKEEKLLFSGKMMQGMMQGGNPIKTLFGSARNMIAGILLIVPGVITDVIAAILLLIPLKESQVNDAANSDQPYQSPPFESSQPHHKHQGEVIEGEYKREE